MTVPTGVYAATADFGGPGSAPLAARVDRATAELAALLEGAPGRPAAEPEVVPFADLLAASSHGDPERGGGHEPWS